MITTEKPIFIGLPDHLYTLLSTVAVSDVDVGEDCMEIEHDESSRTELDSHANMPVVGRHAYIISNSGKTADVKPFSPDYRTMTIPIVDAAVQYDCPYGNKSCILVIRNALYVPSMKNNLIPPFAVREAGVQVHEIPKIQVDTPTVSDHSVYFPETDFRIPLSLQGIFSYFPTSKPTGEMMNGSEDIYVMTPSRWNPHSEAYAANEENMIDWEGNMIEKKDRVQILLSDIEDDPAIAASVQVSSIETRFVDDVIERSHPPDEDAPKPKFTEIPRAADQVSSVLASLSSTLVDQDLYDRLQARADLGRFQASIGSTNVSNDDYLESSDEEVDSQSNDTPDEEADDDDLLDSLFDEVRQGEIDLDTIFVSATHAGRPKGIDAAHLSKVWRIDLDAAKRTLEITSQASKRSDDPTLSRNYGTNDRMLRYKRISEYFFMDTFFATKKAGKSSRGHTCCQLFVTDKGFVYVVPMTSKSEVRLSTKLSSPTVKLRSMRRILLPKI